MAQHENNSESSNSGAVILWVIVAAALMVEGGPVVETGEAWLLLAYMALASTILPMILYYWLLQKVSATYASLIGYVLPIIAVTAGVVLLGEQLQSGIILGGLLILVGVLVTDRAERSTSQSDLSIACPCVIRLVPWRRSTQTASAFAAHMLR